MNLFIETYCKIRELLTIDLPEIVFSPVDISDLKEREAVALKLWNLEKDKTERSFIPPYYNPRLEKDINYALGRKTKVELLIDKIRNAKKEKKTKS